MMQIQRRERTKPRSKRSTSSLTRANAGKSTYVAEALIAASGVDASRKAYRYWPSGAAPKKRPTQIASNS